MYGVVGGKLEWSDLDISRPTRVNGQVLDYEQAIEALLQREALEEAGVSFNGPLVYLDSVAYIRPDNVPSVLIKFAAQYQSGTVQLEESSFSEYAWANASQAAQLPCIDGIVNEVTRTIEIFKDHI
jgi:NADH pyrophosphatase NudC (nudix superfamily)